MSRAPAVGRFAGTTRRVHPRGVLFVTASFFVALGACAALIGVLPADTAVREAVLGLASPPVLRVMHAVNLAGAWQVLLPGTLAVLVVFERARERWWLWLALMVAATASPDVFKVLIGRPRPEAVSLGFPSGHSTAAAAFFGMLTYLAGTLPSLPCRLVRAGSLIMIVLVGVARVMLRAHWPSDVLGGFTLGLALACIAIVIAERPPRRPGA
jgi:membrane-associated phospholipid phosphatase